MLSSVSTAVTKWCSRSFSRSQNCTWILTSCQHLRSPTGYDVTWVLPFGRKAIKICRESGNSWKDIAVICQWINELFVYSDERGRKATAQMPPHLSPWDHQNESQKSYYTEIPATWGSNHHNESLRSAGVQLLRQTTRCQTMIRFLNWVKFLPLPNAQLSFGIAPTCRLIQCWVSVITSFEWYCTIFWFAIFSGNGIHLYLLRST